MASLSQSANDIHKYHNYRR